MRLVGLSYAKAPRLKATAAGRDAWMDWMDRAPARPIEVRVIPAEHGSMELTDFPETFMGSVAMSARALAFMGEKSVEFSGPFDIGGDWKRYVLGWPYRLNLVLAMDGDHPALPLTLQRGAMVPHGRFLEVSWPTKVVDGDLFVTAETWASIEASGLTGLAKVAEYEVLEA